MKVGGGTKHGIASRDWVAIGIDALGCSVYADCEGVECGIPAFEVSRTIWAPAVRTSPMSDPSYGASDSCSRSTKWNSLSGLSWIIDELFVVVFVV